MQIHFCLTRYHRKFYYLRRGFIMDTVTHTLMGGTLLGLATIDPSVDPLTLGFGATVVGASLIPDIDTTLKLKNNAVYIKNHRGITHSIPFTFIIWPVLL